MSDGESKKNISDLTVESIMIRDIYTITPTMTVREAITLLLKEKISGAPLVDEEGVLISVISQIDLIKFAAVGSMDKPITAFRDKLVTAEKLIVIQLQDSFKELLKQFLIKPVRRILVVDGVGKLQGIVSRSTLLQAFMDQSV